MEKYISVPNGIKLVSGWDIDMFRKEYNQSEIFDTESIANRNVVWLHCSDSVEVIGDKAFEHCKNLKTVYLSKNIKHIGFNAFLGCNIENAYYPGSIFDYEYAQRGNGGKPEYHFLHCTDGTFDFTKEKYIDCFPFNGNIAEWGEKYKNHWLNRRADRIVCLDGIVYN